VCDQEPVTVEHLLDDFDHMARPTCTQQVGAKGKARIADKQQDVSR
jgi:hypothetical protein